MQMTQSLKPFITFSLLLLVLIYPLYATAQSDAKPGDAIVVKDFIWGSGGRGQQAMLKEITLKNTGIKEYRNIEIEIELYSRTDTPQGSVRSTIKDVLPPGSEKTYYNVKFGIMHSELQNATARVVRAEEIEKGTPTHARHLLLVKDWEFTGGRYGTEGILKSITIENRSDINFKDIKIKLSNLGTSGPKVGAEGYTSIVVIHDFIQANSTKTFKNINIGFRHPDARRYSIHIMDADRVSAKEIRYKLAEIEKSEGKQVQRKTKATVVEEGEQKSSLAERYKKRLEEEQGMDSRADTVQETTQTVKPEDSPSESVPPEETASTDDEKTTKTAFETDEQEAVVEAEMEEEVPLPKHDIVVKSFKWGSGVPGTIGVMRELTLENISGLTYTKIQLLVEFYSSTGVPLGSNELKIYEVLPAGKTRTFRDLEIGIIQLSPDSRNIRVRVKDASVMKR